MSSCKFFRVARAHCSSILRTCSWTVLVLLVLIFASPLRWIVPLSQAGGPTGEANERLGRPPQPRSGVRHLVRFGRILRRKDTEHVDWAASRSTSNQSEGEGRRPTDNFSHA